MLLYVLLSFLKNFLFGRATNDVVATTRRINLCTFNYLGHDCSFRLEVRSVEYVTLEAEAL